MNEQVREAILEEIDELAGVPTRLPDDITVHELAQRWGVSPPTVVKRMKNPVEQGTYQSLIVYDPGSGRQCRVYRKGDDPAGREPR